MLQQSRMLTEDRWSFQGFQHEHARPCMPLPGPLLLPLRRVSPGPGLRSSLAGLVTQKSHVRCCSSGSSSSGPRWNPQNVDDPQVMPSTDFGPEDCVKAQLEAVRHNDSPWPNHGIQSMYEFGYDIGGMERSRYFGYSKDLYHFLGQFQNAFPELLSLASYQVRGVQEQEEGRTEVAVDVVQGDGRATPFVFVLERKDVGRKKGCLMTKSLRKGQ